MKLPRSVRLSDNMKPAVTVLIDTYNHERFIEEAIVSVLEQDFPSSEMEILVVDDGSTDRTPEIVRKFEPRVRLIRKANGGQASAFNAGIPEAKGEFIAFLDGDDWWAKHKLSRVMQAFGQDPTLGVVGHGIVLVYPDGSQAREVLREGFRFQANTPDGARLFRLRKSFMGTSRMTVRTEVLKQVLPVPERLTIQADEFMFTLAAALSEVRILPEPLFFYRIHDTNAYQMANGNPSRIRRKQEVLAEVARRLGEKLPELGVETPVIRVITEIVQAEADQLRLTLDGGWPWETVRTEWKIYEVMHADASLAHRVFKMLSLSPALFLPPQTYYRARARVVQNRIYRGARERFLPNPPRCHVEAGWRSEP
jgi:GT2 family glycosyltransferase